MLFAEEDLLGDIYYWKSTVTSTGTGGQIWVKSFGDLTPEQQITGPNGSVSAVGATCNGCHALSRDGLRMVVYSDDADSDDEYSDVSGSLIDMQAKTTLGMAAGGGGGFGGGRGGQPPGFSTLSPSHTLYLTSDGANTAPTNTFALWNGNTGMTISTINVGGNAADRPTMPDWSFDGKSVVYVLPNKVAAWSGGVGGNRNDDDHEFGGSLYTLPYSGNQMFGTPSVFLASKGENNYYPGYSPDGQFIVFDRAPKDPNVSAIDGCVTTPYAACPNDSFSNPAARLMLTSATTVAPIDLEKANGSPPRRRKGFPTRGRAGRRSSRCTTAIVCFGSRFRRRATTAFASAITCRACTSAIPRTARSCRVACTGHRLTLSASSQNCGWPASTCPNRRAPIRRSRRSSYRTRTSGRITTPPSGRSKPWSSPRRRRRAAS